MLELRVHVFIILNPCILGIHAGTYTIVLFPHRYLHFLQKFRTSTTNILKMHNFTEFVLKVSFQFIVSHGPCMHFCTVVALQSLSV
uniref:Uncharacterized protein n=1 Tax=Physcomitrium patens TaxID=3218 RepID=A0A2K1JLC9_PHYPA|nr:hypothetical protein PHYPA_017166 [Physcomitrium patens]